MRDLLLASYSSVEECLARYGRNDRHLFKNFLKLAKSLEEIGVSYLLIGSLPIPLLADPRYRGKISPSRDIDLAINRNPFDLTHLLQKYGSVKVEEDHLIKRAYWDNKLGYVVEQDESIVYHLIISNFPDTCMFWKEVNVVPIHDSDFENNAFIQIDGQEISMPRLGLFLATRLHPPATEDTRAYKSALVVESIKYSKISDVATETRERFLEALEANPGKLRVEDFHRTERFLRAMGKRRGFQNFLDYLEIAFDVGGNTVRTFYVM